MSFAKLPTQPPQFDATALMTALKTPATLAKQFIGWKRWCEATVEQDGIGLRDVVDANAKGLNAVKLNVDQNSSVIASLNERVTTLEQQPRLPFPGSSPPTGGV